MRNIWHFANLALLTIAKDPKDRIVSIVDSLTIVEDATSTTVGNWDLTPFQFSS